MISNRQGRRFVITPAPLVWACLILHTCLTGHFDVLGYENGEVNQHAVDERIVHGARSEGLQHAPGINSTGSSALKGRPLKGTNDVS
jgi:hypothetical protein